MRILRLFCLTCCWFAALAVCAQQDFVLGADISGCTELESRGHTLYNASGEERECTALMHEYGMSAVRLRVWVDPSAHGNWCNVDDLVRKALRARALGMDVMVDFHYSDWWADPAKQPIPHAWEHMSYLRMRRALADHTRQVLLALRAHGVTPRWVQIGNETSNGLLWSVVMGPDGWEQKDSLGRTTITRSMGHAVRNPRHYAGFIRAGYDAAKEVLPDVVCIVHLDNGYDQALYDWNLDLLRRYGARWDMVGMSLYPYWALQDHKRATADEVITDCVRNICHVSRKYHCDVMVVETGMEVDEAHPEVMEEGYRQLRRIITECRDHTEGRCRGVFYWYPECIPATYKLGAFTTDGRPTRIMDAFL